MATNLLLEGDDLEALLIKAHAEGGPNARIVRADKYRHGGVWGFFARERFEVAVEIPETRRSGASFAEGHRPERLPAVGGAAFFLPTVGEPAADDAADDRPGAAFARAAASRRSGILRTVAVSPDPGGKVDVIGSDKLAAAGAAVDAAAAVLPMLPALPAPAPAAPAPARRMSAVETLLDMADRVSASERAAARGTRPAITSVDLQAAEAGRGGELVGAGAPVQVRTNRAGDLSVTTSPTPAFTTPAFTTPRASATGPDGASSGPVTPAGPPEGGGRPEFTALLDTLRHGARDGGHDGLPPRTLPSPVRAAYLDTPDDDTPAPPEPAAPPAVPAPAVPAQAVPSPQPVPPQAVPSQAVPSQSVPSQAAPSPQAVPAQPVPLQAEVVNPAVARAEADRATLRALGVPEAWTRRFSAGDRFGEVLRMLTHLPEADIDPDAGVIGVVGPVGTVTLEAYRTALDLAPAAGPRPVLVIPVTPGPARAEALALATRAAAAGPIVVAVEANGSDAATVLEALAAVGASAVITVVDATVPLGATQRWLGALGHVDALALDRASEVGDPAAVLRLGLPVVRLDGIPIDRVTWTALLCAQLVAAEQSAVSRR